jgi:hypothetical protein
VRIASLQHPMMTKAQRRSRKKTQKKVDFASCDPVWQDRALASEKSSTCWTCLHQSIACDVCMRARHKLCPVREQTCVIQLTQATMTPSILDVCLTRSSI